MCRQQAVVRGGGDELVIVTQAKTGPDEVARHELSTPGNLSIVEERYPHNPSGNLPRQPKPGPKTAEEIAFLELGESAHRWLIEAGAAGTVRVRAKMRRAVELAAVQGPKRVDTRTGVGRYRAGLGIVSLATATAALIDPHSIFAAPCVCALIGFHLRAGWKLYRDSSRHTASR
jgi:hypothetical protein